MKSFLPAISICTFPSDHTGCDRLIDATVAVYACNHIHPMTNSTFGRIRNVFCFDGCKVPVAFRLEKLLDRGIAELQLHAYAKR